MVLLFEAVGEGQRLCRLSYTRKLLGVVLWLVRKPGVEPGSVGPQPTGRPLTYFLMMAAVDGIEPSASGFKAQRSAVELHRSGDGVWGLAGPAGLEPAMTGFGGRCLSSWATDPR